LFNNYSQVSSPPTHGGRGARPELSGLAVDGGAPAGQDHRLARAIADECVAVARAEGARLGPATVDQIVAQLQRFPPDLGTSMLFDRPAGRRLEWEARNGVISRLGAQQGIPTPVSDDVARRLAALDEGRSPSRSARAPAPA
jgi:2-dehydropantoate 2-reductase